MTRREILVVTNVPSPYRIHELRVIRQHLDRRGIALSARFMAPTERSRHWGFDPSSLGFDGRLARGHTLYPAPDVPLHLNPALTVEVMRSSARWVLLGGAWYQPPVMAPLVFNGRRGRHLLFWNETVEASGTTRGRAFEAIRRAAFTRFHGFVVPGERSAAYVRTYSGRPMVPLPNFVDEGLYRDRVGELRPHATEVRARFGLPGDAVVFAWPARLLPHKGILPFLQAVPPRPGSIFALAGEGPLRTAIETHLARTGRRDVHLLGHLGLDDLLALYAAADVLLLPSVSEPFGFVAVEALWAGLPIIISAAAGAAPETVVHGVNGWIVDPRHPAEVQATVARAAELGPNARAEMGRRSLELAAERFDSNRSATRFVEQLMEAFPP